MNKNAMLLATVLVFAVSMLAQDSRSSSGNSSQYPAGGSQSGQSSSDSQSGSSGSMGQSGSQSGSMSSSGQSSSDQGVSTVEGCIYREATDYYIYPTSGNEMKVSGQDVSSHLGHHVKLHGAKQAGAGTSASTGGTTGAAAGETSASSQSAGGQGSMAGSSDRAGSSSTGNQFVVERVDMVSATCPSKIRKKIESQGGNLGSSDTGSSTNPPQR